MWNLLQIPSQNRQRMVSQQNVPQCLPIPLEVYAFLHKIIELRNKQSILSQWLFSCHVIRANVG